MSVMIDISNWILQILLYYKDALIIKLLNIMCIVWTKYVIAEMFSLFAYFNCTIFVHFAECWLLPIVEGVCWLFKCYNTLLKVNDVLIYQFCWMVKWYANCFVFVNIDEKLSHFVKLELKKSVIILRRSTYNPIYYNSSMKMTNSIWFALIWTLKTEDAQCIRMVQIIRRTILLHLPKQTSKWANISPYHLRRVGEAQKNAFVKMCTAGELNLNTMVFLIKGVFRSCYRHNTDPHMAYNSTW